MARVVLAHVSPNLLSTAPSVLPSAQSSWSLSIVTFQPSGLLAVLPHPLTKSDLSSHTQFKSSQQVVLNGLAKVSRSLRHVRPFSDLPGCSGKDKSDSNESMRNTRQVYKLVSRSALQT